MDAKTEQAKWEPVQLEILEGLLIRDRMAPEDALVAVISLINQDAATAEIVRLLRHHLEKSKADKDDEWGHSAAYDGQLEEQIEKIEELLPRLGA